MSPDFITYILFSTSHVKIVKIGWNETEIWGHTLDFIHCIALAHIRKVIQLILDVLIELNDVLCTQYVTMVTCIFFADLKKINTKQTLKK